MVRTAALALLSLIATSAAAQTPAGRQFNLVCDGEVTRHTSTPPGKAPYHWEGSFDLDRLLASGKGAVAVGAIEVQPDAIIWGSMRFDRSTGEMVRIDRDLNEVTRAQCHVAPYTPQPRLLF